MDRKNSLIMANKIGDVMVVSFMTSQVLDEMNVQQLGKELDELLENEYANRMVINFAKIKYLSSAVLGKLISMNKKVGEMKGRLAFCGINADILQVFKITRLDKLIPICDDEDDAVKRVQKPGLFGRFK